MTLPIAIVAHHLAVPPHEFAHRLMASGLGHLADPLAMR